MRGNDLYLNSVQLKNRVTALGLKQWWIAEQVGVDRKTVIRWLQGQVKTIQTENARALSQVLGCSVEEICAASAAEGLATAEDQKAAATLLASSSLMEKLGPIGEWNVVESLLRATIVPQLPLCVLGELYLQLTIASWRQSKLEQADVFCRKTLQIADQSGDRALRASALLSQGNLLFWRGKTSQAIATYRECLASALYLPGQVIGSIFSNLGAVLYDTGELAEGILFQEKAIAHFLVHGRPMNLSIAYCHEAMIFLRQENWAEAGAAAEKSIALAEADDYRRGVQMGRLIQAELAARVGNAEAARHAEEVLAAFARLGIEEGLNYEFAARVHRLLGAQELAEKAARRGIELAQGYPLYLAGLYLELGHVLQGCGSREKAQDAYREAQGLFAACEAPLRAAEAGRLGDKA